MTNDKGDRWGRITARSETSAVNPYTLGEVSGIWGAMSEEFKIIRDAKGRIVTRTGPVPGAGGRKFDDAEKIKALARNVLDEETVDKWTKAMRRKLAKGNSFATEYIRDTLAGKPSVQANVTVSSELEAFMMAWRSLQAPGQPAPEALPPADDGPRLLEPPIQVDDSPSETEDS